ncbi:MAG: hypothetical protein Q9M40_06035 [Sulfurimonas sp.]|nr:hypothetical protein [Sulfurimonas sp.]
MHFIRRLHMITKDKSISNQDIIDKLYDDNNIAVVAITDHHIIDMEKQNQRTTKAW